MVKACAVAVSAILGLAALAAAPALADKGHGLFNRADKNGDGFVTRVEFNASRAVMFARLDSSGDGAITQAEIDQARKAFRERHAHSAGKPPVTHNKQHKTHRGFFAKIDANGDGRVGGAEFAAAGDRMFAKLDNNGDGQLTKEEMPRRHKKPAGATDPSATPSQ